MAVPRQPIHFGGTPQRRELPPGKTLDHELGKIKKSSPVSGDISMDRFEPLFSRKEPVLALAPMQDVTDYPFWKLMREYGGADLYFTEFFRVHATSHLERDILKSVIENPTGRPVIAQMIGNDVAALVRTAKELEQYPVAGIDLNLGCPAPVVYRKCAGGGLLREPEKIDAI